MIRIDEIYENTFLPWITKNIPESAIFYCDPFGRSDPDSIQYKNCTGTTKEKNSIFFFDQEPLQVSIHIPTFDRFIMRTIPAERRFLVSSETNSTNLDYICQRFKLQPFYYFFHGWAALDWYRGYDRSFLIPPLDQRQIKKTFFSPNRIIGGERKHRVIALYQMALKKLLHNHISAPAICPVENQSIIEVAKNFDPIWSHAETGILNTLSQIDLPKLFPGEETQRMSSCWLDQIDLATECLIYHVSETVYFGRRHHLTEKTFKPIALGMPFVLNAPAGSLAYLRSYGFKTFHDVWDEDYDTNTNDFERCGDSIVLLKKIDMLSPKEKQKIFEQCIPIVQHNWDHFYNGGFEKILWAELITMLDHLKNSSTT
jgi:hypothetical protein